MQKLTDYKIEITYVDETKADFVITDSGNLVAATGFTLKDQAEIILTLANQIRWMVRQNVKKVKVNL
jgi:hypothetical protein